MDVKTIEACHDILRGVLNKVQKESDTKNKEYLTSIFAEQVTKFLRHHHIFDKLNIDELTQKKIEALENQGYVFLEDLCKAEEVSQILKHFEDRPVFNGHIMGSSDKIPRKLDGEARNFPFGVYQRSDVVSAPHLLRLANDPKIIGIVASYLGCIPTIYSINTYWSFSGSTQKVNDTAKYTQFFHRDRDDFKFCTLFIYLTNVNMESGPHQYIKSSHKEIEFKQAVDSQTRFSKVPLDRLYSEFFSDDVLEKYSILKNLKADVTGSAGSGFIGRPLRPASRATSRGRRSIDGVDSLWAVL